jgi:aspartate beta-hydroxylase
MNEDDLKPQLRAALQLASAGRSAQARQELERLHALRPDSAQAAIALARIASQGGDLARAEAVLAETLAALPRQEMVAVELAVLRAGAGRVGDAVASLRGFLEATPAAPLAWLLLGQMLDDLGQRIPSLMARFEAVTRAHAAGVWREPSATPAHLVDIVGAAVADVHRHRRDVFFGVLEPIREQHGPAALRRVDRALTGYLREWDATPADPMQRPRFFHFPDLPAEPFLDPYLQPWAHQLHAAFADIRDEALSLIPDRHGLEDFVKVREGDRIGNYLGGVQPAWEAFFFYRHGERYHENHARCPRTSAVLESLDLCRIPGQTPEICFSVLRPGTHILPHHGVTNTRTVMHLPLVVPEPCALHLVDRGVHHWREGELVMFDDTFLHEAWNRSDSVRIILLMDCWNPHLTAVEREAMTRIAQTIGALDVALDTKRWHAQ